VGTSPDSAVVCLGADSRDGDVKTGLPMSRWQRTARREVPRLGGGVVAQAVIPAPRLRLGKRSAKATPPVTADALRMGTRAKTRPLDGSACAPARGREGGRGRRLGTGRPWPTKTKTKEQI
jgi:hypothetical protein